MEIHRVAVIGAGVAGRSFALACAAAGFDVVLEDVMPVNLRRAEAEFADLSARKVETPSVDPSVRAAGGRLEVALTVEDAVRAADIVVDFVPDELESKLEIFSLIDRMAPPKTILCTPTQALSITDLASCVYRPERCLALRGQLIPGEASFRAVVRVLYPGAVAAAALVAVESFLKALGLEVQMEADPDAPVLVKNAARRVSAS